MITYIEIDGFKAFHQFKMEFTPFTVIAGANAAGKSNLFDALRFLQVIVMSDNIKKDAQAQRGDLLELFTQYSENKYASQMKFKVEMLVNKNIQDAWQQKATLKYTRLCYEVHIERVENSAGMLDLVVVYEKLINLKHDEDKWIKILPKANLENWRPKVLTGRRQIPYLQTSTETEVRTVEMPQDGTTGNKRRYPLTNATRSVLSVCDTVDFPHALAAKQEIMSWKFLELNPEDLRTPTNKVLAEDKISTSGKNLAAVLHRIKQNDAYSLKEILRKLQRFLPNFAELDVVDDTANKQYVIKLIDSNKREYTSRVLSEGTLRILALCILEHDDKHTGLLCFEEPENGVHPARIQTMVELLKDLSIDFSDNESLLRQVIVNTHSPILVGKVYYWRHDDNVSLWYAEMRNQIIDIQNERLKLNVTKMTRVHKEVELMVTDDPYGKYTLTAIKQYLETTHSNS